MIPERKPRDLPRDELLAHAQEVCNLHPGAQVNFKYTCSACGQRVIFDEPNKLYERGICPCGHEQEVTEGGYILYIPPS